MRWFAPALYRNPTIFASTGSRFSCGSSFRTEPPAFLLAYRTSSRKQYPQHTALAIIHNYPHTHKPPNFVSDMPLISSYANLFTFSTQFCSNHIIHFPSKTTQQSNKPTTNRNTRVNSLNFDKTSLSSNSPFASSLCPLLRKRGQQF